MGCMCTYVNNRVRHEHEVVSVCEVEEVERNGCEAQDERSNGGVADSDHVQIGVHGETGHIVSMLAYAGVQSSTLTEYPSQHRRA